MYFRIETVNFINYSFFCFPGKLDMGHWVDWILPIPNEKYTQDKVN